MVVVVVPRLFSITVTLQNLHVMQCDKHKQTNKLIKTKLRKIQGKNTENKIEV